MKSIKTLVICLLVAASSMKNSSAQNISINTTGNAAADAAMLDVSSTTKGVLIPRVSLTAIGTYAPLTGTAVTSLLVYSGTAPTGGGGVGYYYWDGAKWVHLLNGGSGAAAWLTGGNAGTVDGTNFLGTTDDIPFTIRVNNVRAGRIDNATDAKFNTSLGYLAGNAWTGAGVNNAAMGYNALLLNSTGLQNTAVGSGALKSITTNSNSTAVGYNALTLSTAALNTAVGSEALSTNTSGNGNTAVGGHALRLNTGNNNTAVGQQAMATNAGGLENTAMGLSALKFNTYGSRNIAIGYQAMELQGTFLNANTQYPTQNIAIGYQALQFNNPTTAANGMNNIAIGYQALNVNLNASGNVAIGTSAMALNTRAMHNTALGDLAMYTQTYNGGGTPWSTSNVAIGDSALYTNNPTNTTNGYRNTAVGSQAMKANTTGSNNAGVGSSALAANTTGIANAAVGSLALSLNTVGTNNTASGYRALRNNASAGNNVAIGADALYTQSYDPGFWNSENVAIGYQAMYFNQPTSITTGYQNTAIGTQALYTNTTGKNNAAFGFKALFTNSTGGYNTAGGMYSSYGSTLAIENTSFGYASLYSNKTGGQNVAIGPYALYSQSFDNTNSAWSANNVAVGYHALYTNQPTSTSDGNSNTAIGNYAQKANTAGYNNVAVGTSALFSNLTGANNTVAGYQAGFGVAANSYSNNSIFGYRAGYVLTSGSNNLLFGYQAGNAITTGGSNIIIGYDVDAPLATGSNQMSIGNMIFATGVDGTGTTVSSGKVGIRTVTPLSQLDVNGGVAIGSYAGVSAAPANGLIVSGPLGVGTATPNLDFGELMEVYNGNLFVRNGATGFAMGLIGVGSTSTGLIFRKDGTRHAAMKWDGRYLSVLEANISCCLSDVWGGTAATTWDIATGNVGIATNAPLSRLDVNGGVAIGSYAGVNVAPTNGIIASGFVGVGTTGPNRPLEVYSATANNDGRIRVTATSTTAGQHSGIEFYGTGGNANAFGGGLLRDQNTNSISLYSGSSGVTALFTVLDAGNVGIGILAPTAALDVKGAADVAGQIAVQLRSGNTGSNFNSNQITFGYNNTDQYRHAIKTRHQAAGPVGNAIDFYVWKQTTDAVGTIGTQHVMTMDGNGYVGIGSTAPAYPLDITSTNAPAQTFNTGKYGTTASATAWTSAATTNLVNPAISIKAAGYIWGVGILSSSDRRAKENVVSRNSSESLELINKLNPVKYNWIDRSKSVSAFEEGFIAQEVEQVLPQVINTNVETIPSIMELVEKTTYANNQLVFDLKKSDKLKAGVVLKVILEDGKEYKWTVASVNEREIKLNVEEGIEPSGKIFVYGQEVKDFKTVDYDKVFTVGISAIQELAKQNERQQAIIDAQEQSIQLLKEEVTKIKTHISSQASK